MTFAFSVRARALPLIPPCVRAHRPALRAGRCTRSPVGMPPVCACTQMLTARTHRCAYRQRGINRLLSVCQARKNGCLAEPGGQAVAIMSRVFALRRSKVGCAEIDCHPASASGWLASGPPPPVSRETPVGTAAKVGTVCFVQHGCPNCLSDLDADR